MTAKEPKPPARRSRYSESEGEQGLVALALYSNNSRRAPRLLKQHGLSISARTLADWPVTFADEYARVRAEILPRLKQQLAEEHTALARQEMGLSRDLLAKLKREAEEIPARDLSTTIRNLDVGSGIHSDKARDLRGDPTAVVERRSDSEREKAILRKLTTLGVVIEGEAEETNGDRFIGQRAP